ncbi:hypothetical protein IRA69_05905 [Campylobacter hepaticus]|nr:hypothetical protein IRA69_05905 [Campylobacter hepaticus]
MLMWIILIKINIPYIINKGIIAGSLNIENKNQTQKDASINVNTIDNQGFLKNAYIGIWGDKQANITINSFSNSGIVYNSQDQAIYLEKNVQITDFTNTGLIAGTTNKHILGSQKCKQYPNRKKIKNHYSVPLPPLP